MSHVHRGTGAMPSPNSSKAPIFNSEMLELLEFFEVFEDLASTYGLTSADKCKSLVCYVDRQIKRFWIMLMGFESREYGTFKKSILTQNPGASKGQRYTIHELECIIVNQVDSNINTEKELMNYYRLLVRAHHQILQWLELKDPDFNCNEPAHFKKVVEAGHHVFLDEAFNAEFNDPITLRIQSIRDRRAPLTTTSHRRRHDALCKVQTKIVRFMQPQVPVQAPQKSTMDELACLSPTAANAWAAPCTRQLCSNVSTAPPVPSSAPLLPKQCLFCGQSHYLQYSQVAAEYLRTGRIIRIENLQQAVDRHAQSIASSTPSSNPPPTTIPSSAFMSESYFLQCTRIVENHATVTTVKDDDSGADTLAITCSKAKNVVLNSDDPAPLQEKSNEATSLLSSSHAHQQTRSINVPLPDIPLAPPKKTPAYVYESKAAIPDAASCIYQSMLNMAVPNVTITDLLTVSSDLRREAVEHCKTHRVSPPSSATTLAAAIPVPPPQIEHATPLRELKVTLNGIHMEMALLDEGSELVVI
ncbi:hypothetical protein DFJ58DRAFT_721750 [Suillus subalutaceus]|uniref:uncharacterized protein n=1 Tax=Suillus subalutaceus TaxID=48586 RepID=UPI001B880CD2|nr:uncharacterized protein DFJ58DRAFT_721750 [Suillus subalutaceus]KAG1874755.1 hypothetical protein DFJ58DRAFT_721750 [Suillus subalutaceus]